MDLVEIDHRRGLDELIAIAHVEFERMLDLAARHALAQQILCPGLAQFGDDAC